MKKNIFIALIALVVLVSLSVTAWAALLPGNSSRLGSLYRFDDVYGPSGIGGQWVVVGTSADLIGTEMISRKISRGNSTSMTRFGEGAVIKTEGNFVNDRSPIYSVNGMTTVPYNDPGNNNLINSTKSIPMDYIFMVIPENRVGMDMDFKWISPDLNPWDAFTIDVRMGEDHYHAVKDPSGPVAQLTNRFHFDLTKTTNQSAYETLRTYMTFHQNPLYISSQTINVPLVIANVADGDATVKPLEFHTILRAVLSNGTIGDIVAEDHFEWNVTSDREFGVGGGGGDAWVFVPVENANVTDVRYHLTTRVRNFSGIRYALQRYDRLPAGEVLNAQRWTMDLPAGVLGVDPNLPLDELSHIAPGMITTYEQTYNALSGGTRVFGIYPVDPPSSGNTPRNLLWRYRPIRGVKLGDARRDNDDTYSVQGFRYVAGNRDDFLKNAATQLRDPKSSVNIMVRMPEEDVMTDASVGSDPELSSNAPSTVKIDVPIPQSLQYNVTPAQRASSAVVGLLPLHLTFNLHKENPYVGPMWNDLLDRWKRQGGNFMETFSRSFRVKMHDTNAATEDIDLTEWLESKGLYTSNVKVSMNEAEGHISVSLIVMLVDSTEWAPKTPALLTDDKLDGGATTRKYPAIWDGNRNNRWDMTFYVAYTAPQSPAPVPGGSGEGGGGGCNAGLPLTVGMIATVLLAFWNRKEDDER